MKKATRELIESKPRFGKLVLTGKIMLMGENKGRNEYKVEAICDCGSIKFYFLDNLKSNSHRRNCGCMRAKQGGSSIAKTAIKDLIVFCKKAGYEFYQHTLRVNKRKIFFNEGRFFYVDNGKDVIKSYYDDGGYISTSYRGEGGVNHLSNFRGR